MAFDMSEFHIHACIKGYHSYKIKPEMADSLEVKRDSSNKVDKKAVGVYFNKKMIGHVPATPVPLHTCIEELMEKYIVTW